jgi:heme/copper-type cytochrome/quinol oxidase subunit 2
MALTGYLKYFSLTLLIISVIFVCVWTYYANIGAFNDATQNLNMEMFLSGIVAFFTCLMAIATLIMAIATFSSVEQRQNDRKLALIQKRLEEFYFPLISIIGGKGEIGAQNELVVNQLLWSKRYLAGPKTAKVLPDMLNAMRSYERDNYFDFSPGEKGDYAKMTEWVKVANTMWDESTEYVKEYYALSGVSYEKFGERPEWRFRKKG